MTIKRACIVVLGDWGRSPRMQYHALSLAENGFVVEVVTYSGTSPHEAIKQNPLITQHSLRNVPKFENYFPRLLVFILKVLWQSFFLFTSLLRLSKPDIILIQNPPSVPTLPVCWFVCLLRKTKMIIDFHNYGYTILALSVGKKHGLVKLYKWCERYFGQKSSRNICVTRAMKEDLANSFNICASTFYDCPPEIFHPVNLEEKHSFFAKLSKEYSSFKSSSEQTEDTNCSYTAFTMKNDDGVTMLSDRPALIMSSTSWTEDEDFSILLDALQGYDENATHSRSLPKLILVITGKGPLKEMYEKLIAEKKFQYVEINTMWLPAKHYPTMLACADLGISLHCSSSNLDLPMKVVDMFGSGLPVCAYRYQCINELVKENINGLCFSNSEQLSSQLQKLFKDFPSDAKELQKYRNNLSENPPPRWHFSWNKYVLPIMNELVS